MSRRIFMVATVLSALTVHHQGRADEPPPVADRPDVTETRLDTSPTVPPNVQEEAREPRAEPDATPTPLPPELSPDERESLPESEPPESEPTIDEPLERTREERLALEKSDPWESSHFRIWGFNEAMRKFNAESVFGRLFYARQDRVLTAARLRLELAETHGFRLSSDIRGLEISLNGDVAAVIGRESLLTGPRRREIVFDPRLLVEENEFVLRFLTYSGGPCQPIVAPGTWWIIKSGVLDTRSQQLRLPNDLSLLPLPFFDQRTDREPSVQIAFLEPPNTTSLQAAGLVASYFGNLTGAGGVRFKTSIGKLPEGHAVVLTTGGVAQLGLPENPIDGPSIRMIDHPGPNQQLFKLLVVKGQTPEELLTAATRLTDITWSSGAYDGAFLDIDRMERGPRPASQELPTWFVQERETSFGQIMKSDEELIHRGHAGETLRLEFRILPELLAEPAEYLRLDIEYLQRLPEPFSPAKLDVEFNGIHVMTLPSGSGGLNPIPRHQRLTLPRNQLRGVNRLQFHVSALQHRELCNAESRRMVETSVSGDSMLRLVGEKVVTHLPDVEAFVYDGLPYTSRPNLEQTVIILPVSPDPREIGTALSIVSNFAGATGRPSTGLLFAPETAVHRDEVRNRSMILVGTVSTSTLLREWSDLLPLATTGGALRVRTPSTGDSAAELLRARWLRTEAGRAALFLARAERPGVVMGMESPYASGKSVIVVTAASPDELPAMIDLQGYTEARLEDGGDLLLMDEERRAIFRLGPLYLDSDVGLLARIRSTLAVRWLVLMPLIFIAALLFALLASRHLRRREEERLAIPESD